MTNRDAMQRTGPGVIDRGDGRRDGRRDGRDGFLLVEVMFSMLILAMALMAIVPMFVLATKENTSSGDLTLATTAAMDKAEGLKNAAFAGLANGQDTITVSRITFNRSWTVQADNPLPGMKTVTVSVSSTRQVVFGATRTATLRFYRAR